MSDKSDCSPQENQVSFGRDLAGTRNTAVQVFKRLVLSDYSHTKDQIFKDARRTILQILIRVTTYSFLF